MKRWTLLIAASLIALAGPTAATAFDQAQYAAVKGGSKDCPWCNLSGANLTNVDFSGGDLSGADFTGADLTGARLANVNLTGADLTGANLTGAILSGADFTLADLDQVDVSAAVWKNAKLEKANCDWATKLPEASNLSCLGVTIERN
jgi:uncharacterized protein YjbI with pentapeptide repeats